LIIFVKFLEAKQRIFIKIDTRIMSIIPTKETDLIHNFNFDEKTLIQFKKVTIKITKLHHFLKNWDQIETKKYWRTNLIFLSENKNQKSNFKIFI